MATTPADEFDHLAYLKAEAKRAQAAADDAKKRAKEFEAFLWQKYDEQQTYGLRTGMGRYELKQTTYGTITDYAEFKAWVEENDLSDEYLKTTEESARLNELVRERLDTSQELPPGVSYYHRRYISHTGNKEDA